MSAPVPFAATTPSGKPIAGTVEVDLVLGRVYYTVAKVGTFTIERDDHYGSDGPDDPHYLHVTYGRWDFGHRYSGYEVLPESPKVFGIDDITGGWVFDPAKPSYSGRWNAVVHRRAGRYCSRPVPDGTRRRIGDIVGGLVAHWLAHPQRAAADHARLVREAPGRLAAARREEQRLREAIAAKQAELDVVLATVAAQNALMAPPQGELTTVPVVDVEVRELTATP